MKNLISIFILITLSIACNKSGEVSPNTKEEVLKTAKGTLIGSPITQIIGNTGGKIAIPSAGATIIVPSGAMAAGASLTIQATSDMLDNEGQGIQISGEWQKPIWLEFSYPADETSPESNMIAYQTAKGDWITTKKVKVDKVRKTYAILLGQTSNGKAKLNGARPAAGSYSFAASHEFFMKPDKAVIDLGESVTFTAFARQGDTDGFWRKGKDGNYFYDDGELVPLSTPKTPILSNNNPEDDDYLVPLIPISKTVLPDDDDYLVPLTKVIKEAAFTNKKTGFTRSWILMKGPGNLAPTGNIGAKYTAPKDALAKGKTARISFLSRNDKTKQDVEASATIRIKDGLTRYEGTIKLDYKWIKNTETEIKDISFAGTLISTNSSNTIFRVVPNEFSTSVNGYLFSNTKDKARDEIVSPTKCSQPGDAELVMVFDNKTKKYRVWGYLQCNKVPINVTFFDGRFYGVENRTVGAEANWEPISNTAKYYDIGDGKTLSGLETITHQFTTITTKWDFKRVD
jgi:hypothetical protein